MVSFHKLSAFSLFPLSHNLHTLTTTLSPSSRVGEPMVSNTRLNSTGSGRQFSDVNTGVDCCRRANNAAPKARFPFAARRSML